MLREWNFIYCVHLDSFLSLAPSFLCLLLLNSPFGCSTFRVSVCVFNPSHVRFGRYVSAYTVAHMIFIDKIQQQITKTEKRKKKNRVCVELCIYIEHHWYCQALARDFLVASISFNRFECWNMYARECLFVSFLIYEIECWYATTATTHTHTVRNWNWSTNAMPSTIWLQTAR